jgi:transposase
VLVLALFSSVPVTGSEGAPPVDDGGLREQVARLMAVVSGLEARLGQAAAEARAREDELLAELAAERARGDRLQERCDALSRRLGKDSSNSSKPPSSDGPYRKPRDRSLRGKSGRRPGRQPGAESSTLRLVPDPDEDIACPPAQCACCGSGLDGQPVLAEQRRQVFEAPEPPPGPKVTQYRVQARACPRCGHVSEGSAPAGVTGRVQYGPRAHAIAAFLTCWHHVPVLRSAQLAAALSGLPVSAGFAAGARGRAAALLAPFTARVRELLSGVPVLHADETPARVAGGTRYLHVACTGYLTALHAGDRSREAMSDGGILPGYHGTLVRDGYSAYEHLTGALHAWCGAHLLRDLKGLRDADPAGQQWAEDMAAVLAGALTAARQARAGGQAALSEEEQQAIRDRYREAVADGLQANAGLRTAAGRDGFRLARRFSRHAGMILRFITDLDVPFTNNQAERDLRPVKVQQNASGTWRTLLGFADFAVVRSYLSTAGKWGIHPLDALTRLFTDGPWLPPAAAPG